MNTTHRSSVRRTIRIVRIRWINFKSLDFLQWQNSLPVIFNVTEPLSSNALVLPKPATSSECRRLDHLSCVDCRKTVKGTSYLICYYVIYAVVRKVAISVHQGVQQSAVQLVGSFLPCHGGARKIRYKVHIGRDWGMGDVYFPRDIYSDVLVG